MSKEKETIKIVSYNTKNPERRAELDAGIAKLMSKKSYELVFPDDDEQAVRAIEDAEILLTWRFTEEMFAAAEQLKWIQASGAGVDKFLFPSFRSSNIVLTNTRGIHGTPMAEWVLGALTYIAQRFDYAEKWKQNREWNGDRDFMVRNRFTLEGKKALIAGFGYVGSVIEKKLSAVGIYCEAIVSRSRLSHIPFYKIELLEDIIGEFDIVVIALPLTDKTENLFDLKLLTKMKQGSILVNVARGKIMDEAALIQVLKNGPLAFAALDVFREEPLPSNSTLFELPNVFMTPHISGNFPEYTKEIIKSFLKNLERYLKGEALESIVDKQRGY